MIDAGIEVSSLISCDAGLEENIRKANKSDDPVIAVEISNSADLDEFGAAQYAIRKPLCLVCDDKKLLEEALRLYQGRAMYAGNISTEELIPMTDKYGLII